MKSPSPKPLIATLLGACLFACNSPSDPVDTALSPGAPSESGSEFDRSALSIKAGPYSQQEKNAALQALASRYGHVVLPQADPEPGQNLNEAAKPAAGALGKTASVRLYPVKSAQISSDFVLRDFRIVKANQTLTAWTTRPPRSTADPFLVAFHDTQLFNDRNAMLTKIVGLNDDDAGLDSRFSWKNPTGKDQGVEIIAFAYQPSVSGTATLFTTVNGGSVRSYIGNMGGTAVFEDNISFPVNDCPERLTDLLSLKIVQRGDARYEAMMVNSQTMTGGWVGISGDQPNVSLNILTATPSGYPNFMLALAYGGTTTGSYTAKQSQTFNCNF